jgi:hypothetical protein
MSRHEWLPGSWTEESTPANETDCPGKAEV